MTSLKQLSEAATPGPWRADGPYIKLPPPHRMNDRRERERNVSLAAASANLVRRILEPDEALAERVARRDAPAREQ